MKTMHAKEIMVEGKKSKERHLFRSMERAILNVPLALTATAFVITTGVLLFIACSSTPSVKTIGDDALKCVSLKEVASIYNGRAVVLLAPSKDASKKDTLIFLADGLSTNDLSYLNALNSSTVVIPIDSALKVMPGARVVAPKTVQTLIPYSDKDIEDLIRRNLIEGDKRKIWDFMGKKPDIVVEMNFTGTVYYLAGFGERGRISVIRTIDATREHGDPAFFRVLTQTEAEKVLSDPNSKMAFIGG
jgi:hypothetical protein